MQKNNNIKNQPIDDPSIILKTLTKVSCFYIYNKLWRYFIT